jgi:hypothetical protein
MGRYNKRHRYKHYFRNHFNPYYYRSYFSPYYYGSYLNPQYTTRYGSCIAHGNTQTVLIDNCNHLNGMIAAPLENGNCVCRNINGVDMGIGNISL